MNTYKNIFVSGVSKGLGLGFAEHYLSHGCKVAGGARNINQSAILNLKERYPEHFFPVCLDVTNLNSVEQAFEQTRLKLVTIDLLINNAGRLGDTQMMKDGFNEADFLQTIKTNVLGPLYLTKTFVPLLERGNTKTVVHVTSRMGSIEDNSSGGYVGYRISKAALNMLSKNIAIEYRSSGIISVVLHPGWVQTDMGGKGAPLTVDKSIAGLTHVIAELKPSDSGSFLDYLGNTIPF